MVIVLIISIAVIISTQLQIITIIDVKGKTTAGKKTTGRKTKAAGKKYYWEKDCWKQSCWKNSESRKIRYRYGMGATC